MSLEFPKVDLTKVTDAMEDVNTSLRKLAEEIQKRKDDAMAMAFTRHICDLLSENGVVVEVTEIEQTRNAKNRFEAEYGFAFTGLDFSEHDKKVAEEKDKRILELEKIIDEKSGGWGKHGLTFSEIIELQDRRQSDCIRINQLLTTIDVLTERYQKLREIHGL